MRATGAERGGPGEVGRSAGRPAGDGPRAAARPRDGACVVIGRVDEQPAFAHDRERELRLRDATSELLEKAAARASEPGGCQGDGAVGLASGAAGGRSARPGHQTRLPMRAVRLGEKNIDMTNAASAMPQGKATPICWRIEFPARVSDANVPARIRPAAAIVGPDCRMAWAAASCGVMPDRASSRNRAIMRML